MILLGGGTFIYTQKSKSGNGGVEFSLLAIFVIWVYNKIMISYMPLMRTLDEKGLTLSTLEAGLGLTKTTFRQTMNRGGFLRVSTLLRIAEYLECNVESLISWNEDGNSTVRYQHVKWDVIADLCKKNTISLSTVSERLGHNWNFMARAKSGDRSLSPVDIEKIAGIFGISEEEFLK